MSSENETAPGSGQGGDEVYYVENVDGTDFTFYLSAENNLHLLPPPKKVSGEQGQESSPTERFSYSRQLTVVKCSPLYKRSDVPDAVKFLKRLGQALADPKAAWAKSLKRFSG